MKYKYFVRTASRLLFAVILLVAGHTKVLASPTELSLNDCVNLALQNNPKLGIAQAANQQSTWDVEQAKSNSGFWLSYNHVSLRTDSPPPYWPSLAPVPTYNLFSNNLKLTVPIYTGGKLEHSIDAAKQGAKISGLGVDATKQQLKLETSAAYFRVLQARNLLTIARQATDDFSNHLKNVQSHYDAGTVALSDVLQTKVKLANAEDGFIKAQNNYDLAVYNLNNVMGLPLRHATQLKENLEYHEDLRSLDDCITFALNNRLEIAQAQARVKLVEDEVEIVRSGRKPTVGFAANTGWKSLDFPGADNRNWTVAIQADMDLFDSGNTKSRIEKARAGVVVVQKQLRQMQDNISLEVSQAYQNMKEAEKRIETSKVAVEHAALDFKLAQERYDAGVGINLDVMDAELALTQANTNYSQALYDYNTSQAQLDKAIGVRVEAAGN